MNILAYDGFYFDEITSMSGNLDADTQNRWSVNTSVVPRGADVAQLGTGAPSPRIIDVTFVYEGTSDFWEVFDKLIGRLNPEDQGAKRKLIATRPDTTEVWRYARITEPSGWDVDGAVNTAVIRFISADPKWYKSTTRTVAPFADSRGGTDTSAIIPGPNNPAIALPNTGFATTQPALTIYTGGAYPGSGGWKYRRRLSITNNLTRTVENHVSLIDIGDTSALVSGSKALSSGDDYRVIGPDGNEVPRNLVAWNATGSWMYVYVPSIAPGDTLNYWIVYGNSAAGAPLTLTYPYQPAFRTDWASGTSITAGSTTTVIRIASINTTHPFSPVADGNDYFKDAALYFTSGSNAGTGRVITTNTWNAGGPYWEFTVTSAFGAAVTTTDDWVIITSRNGKWLWGTMNTVERGWSSERGRWYINSNEGYPSIVSYDVPGSWKLDTYSDGRDRAGVPGYTRITNAGDADPYAILNAYRTYENANVTIPEEGNGDGVSLSTPFPITGYDWSGTLVNPTGMAKGVIGTRSFGGNAWNIADSLDTVNALTSWTSSPTIPTGTSQIFHGLAPYEGEEITQKWRKDSGTSSTTGTATTINDSTKAWRTNQWAGIGCYAKITNGKKAGQLYAISANTATQLTVATMGVSSPAGLSYEIVGPDVAARVYDGARCTVTWDDSDLDIAALGTEEFCTDLSVRFWMGGGKSSSSVLSGQRRGSLEVGKDPDSFVLVKDSSFYNIVADSRTRTAIQYDAVGGSVVERYTPPRVEWLYTDADGLERAATNGLPIPPNLYNTISNPSAETNTASWTSANQAGIGYTFTRVTTRYAGEDYNGVDSAASFRLNITSNTGGPLYCEAVCDDRFAIKAGQLAQFSAFVRTSSANIYPLLGIRFYTALSGGSTISTDVQASATYTTGVWFAEGFASVAPATALSWSPVIRAYVPSGVTTGDINFDVVDPAAPVLFLQTDHDLGQFSVAYTEAFYQ